MVQVSNKRQKLNGNVHNGVQPSLAQMDNSIEKTPANGEHRPPPSPPASPPPPSYISSLPEELIIRVFASIDDVPSLCAAAGTCRYWNDLIFDPTTDKTIWLPLAVALCGRKLLPSNKSSAGSLVPGRYEADASFKRDGRWRYLYRDVVKNAYTYARIKMDEGVDGVNIEYVPAECTLPPLSEVPGGKEGTVVRKFDIIQVATEGSRTHYAPPIVSVKVPNFSDSLAPGETVAGEGVGWVTFVDSPLHIRYKAVVLREGQDPHGLHTAFTVQKGVIRGGVDGVLGKGGWDIQLPKDPELKEAESASSSRMTAKKRLVQLKKTRKGFETLEEWVGSEESKSQKWEMLRWIRPCESEIFPNARMWDKERTLMNSIKEAVKGEWECRYESIRGPLSGSLAGIINSMVHSDSNLRLLIRKLPSRRRLEDFAVEEVERLALPAQASQTGTAGEDGQEPIAVVNKRWKMPNPGTGFKMSLNSVPIPRSIKEGDTEALANETYWLEHEDLDFEASHTWEYRSCGEYMVLCDDVSGRGPSTVSCFKAGIAGTERFQEREHANKDPKPAAVRNLILAKDSDLFWQRQMRIRLRTIAEGDETGEGSVEVDYFVDNDGLAMTSKAVVYSSRKQILTLRTSGPEPNVTTSARSILEFHVLNLENGHTVSVLNLPEEEQDISGRRWYGWISFAVSDTHLVASVGGTKAPDNARDVWESRRQSRYGKKAVYVWPLDNDEEEPQYPKCKYIQPTGRLGAQLDGYEWWTKRDKYVSISRDGRYVGVSSDWCFAVFDMWRGARLENVYRGAVTGQPDHALEHPFIRPLRDGDKNCLPWNGLWLKYRDVLQPPPPPPPQTSPPNPHNTPHETELKSGMVYVNAHILRHLLDGVKPYDPSDADTMVTHEEWRRFLSLMGSWYGPGGGNVDGDSDEEGSVSMSDSDSDSISDSEEDSDSDGGSDDSDDFYFAEGDVDALAFGMEGDMDLIYGDGEEESEGYTDDGEEDESDGDEEEEGAVGEMGMGMGMGMGMFSLSGVRRIAREMRELARAARAGEVSWEEGAGEGEGGEEAGPSGTNEGGDNADDDVD